MQIGFVLFQSRECIRVAKGPGPKPLLGELQQCAWSRSQADPRSGATELLGQGFAAATQHEPGGRGAEGRRRPSVLSAAPGCIGPTGSQVGSAGRWGFHPAGHRAPPLLEKWD